jgi:CHAT domain-containing protein
LADAQNLAVQLQLDRGSAMKAAATPERNRLLLRLEAIGLSIDLLLGPHRVADAAKALASRALAPGGDPVAYTEAIHALSWSLRGDDETAFETIETLQERARSAFAPNTPIVGIAELDLADRAEASKHYDAARRALRGARPVLDSVPDRLSNPMRYRDLALLVSTLNDADLTAWVRLGFLRSIAYPDVIPDEGFRLDLLGTFLSNERDDPDALIAALDAAIPGSIEAGPFRTRMIAELASTLASQDRGAELSAPMAVASDMPPSPLSLDKIRALVDKGGSNDESLSGREQALRKAIAASPIGGEVPPLDALRARLELVKLLGPLHRVPDADRLIAQTMAEMQKAHVPAPVEKWFLDHVAGYAAEFRSDRAGFFRDSGPQTLANGQWDELRKFLRAPGPFRPIYEAFSKAARLQGEIPDKSMLVRRLEEFVPLLATRLSEGSGPDDVFFFARVYQRALLDVGEEALAGIVGQQAESLASAFGKAEDTSYVDFCQVMLAAGDARFSAVAPTCKGGKVSDAARAVAPVRVEAGVVVSDNEALIEPQLDLLWTKRFPEDRATARTLSLGILGGDGGADRRALTARAVWLTVSSALHKALAAGTDPLQIGSAAASASEAWSRYAPLMARNLNKTDSPPELNFDLAALRAALRDDEALVVFSLAPSAAIVIRHDRVRMSWQSLDLKSLAGQIADYRGVLQPSTNDALPVVSAELGYLLYRELLGPIEANLGGVRRLILDLPPELAPLPFAALVTAPPAEPLWTTASAFTPPWLALKWETSVIAHPMLIPMIRGHQTPRRDANLVLAGDPLLPEASDPKEFSAAAILATQGPRRAALVKKMFERLPGAGAEIQGVAAQVRADHVQILSGADFTAAALRKAVSPGTTHLLLATHAAIGSAGQSILVTTPTDADDGGVLTADDILGLPLNAELTVLSACRTGATANAASSFGEITTSLLMAGSRRVLTTLWPLASEGAADMTVPFFHRLLADPDTDPASALNAAARRLSSGKGGASLRHPAFWAGYVLVGDP